MAKLCIKARPPQLKDLRIECDFRRLDGHLFHAPGTEPGIIDQEYEATKKVGMPEGVYDPLCKPVKSAGTFLSANLTTAKNFAEYVAPSELSSYDELKPGEGLRARASARSPVIATRRASYSCAPPPALTLAAICTGTVSSVAGTAAAMVPVRAGRHCAQRSGVFSTRGNERVISDLILSAS